MAEDSGSGMGVGMVLGVLGVLIALVVAFLYFGGGNLFGGGTKSVDVNVSAPSMPSAK